MNPTDTFPEESTKTGDSGVLLPPSSVVEGLELRPTCSMLSFWKMQLVYGFIFS